MGRLGKGVSAQRNTSPRNCKSLRPWVPKKFTLVERTLGDLLLGVRMGWFTKMAKEGEPRLQNLG